MQQFLVLSALAESSDQAQRDIAQATGLSLAKVNFCLRQFVERGQVKLRSVARNPNKLGYFYLLTPEGLREKSRLAYHFLRRAARQYSQLAAQVTTSLDAIERSGAVAVIFLGAGDVAGVCYQALHERGSPRLVAVVEEGRAGMGFHGHQVKPESWLSSSGSVDPVLVCEAEFLPRARALVADSRLYLLG